MQGWVSIHRKIMNNPVWQDPKLLKLWMLCLLEASHKEHEQLVGKQIIKLQPGQFVTGRFVLAKTFNEGVKKSEIVPESTLWRWLKLLETNDFLNINSNTKYSVITIINWNQYQQNEQQMNNKWTANEQPVDTNNNGNKGNNENKKDTTTTTANYFDEYMLCFSGQPSSIQIQEINSFIDQDGLNVDVVCAAFKKAAEVGAKYPYARSILNSWSKKGIRTIADVEIEQTNYEKRKQQQRNKPRQGVVRTEKLPDWFDEDQDKQPKKDDSDIERKKAELDEMLKKLRSGS